ncbi:MAG: hypothetical protein KKH99_02795, partial [Proteobacteria bacterium]|nr:hypothetical protein [Pseudomonadota bacterium]
MDLFDDIEDSTGINEKTPFFQLVEKNLPSCDIILISETGERMVSRQSASFVDTAFETALWEKTKQENSLIFSANKNDSFVCAWYLEKMQCLLVCAFADEFDLFSVKKMISPIVMLCAEVCYKDKLLAEEKENLAVHKQQRDRKINVLEKKYADILIENQRQSAEYSKLLHSEIQRQTAELKRSNKALRL